MAKKLITLFIIFLIGFSFTADCSAVILENLPTTDNSPRPIPAEIISNMSTNNFDINVYKANRYASSSNNTVSANETSVSNPNGSAVQNNPGAKTTANNNFWYWLAIYALIIIFVLSLFFKRKKSE